MVCASWVTADVCLTEELCSTVLYVLLRLPGDTALRKMQGTLRVGYI
jgi:hypothetical protein